MTPLKTLIVGFGGIARGLAHDERMSAYFPIATHAQALGANENFEWIGVIDPDADARAAAETDWQVPGYATLADAVHLRPDVLVLAAPPGARAKALAAFPSVRAVFAEKPLGGADGQDLFRACAEKDIPLQINYWRRGDETLGTLAAGDLMTRIGKLQAATGIYGNGLANNGSHLIDMIRMLAGEPQWVQAIGTARPLSSVASKDDVNLAFAFEMPGGATISVHPVDFSHYREVALDLWGTSGRLALQQETLDIRHLPRTENRGLDTEFEIAADRGEALPCTVAEALPRLYGNLYDAAVNGAALLSPGDSALETERLLNAILKSANEDCRRIDVQHTA